MEFVTESLRLGSPAQAGSGLCWVGFWMYPRMETPESAWETSSSVWPPCRKKLNLPRCGELWHLVMMPTFSSWLSSHTMKQNPNLFNISETHPDFPKFKPKDLLLRNTCNIPLLYPAVRITPFPCFPPANGWRLELLVAEIWTLTKDYWFLWLERTVSFLKPISDINIRYFLLFICLRNRL